MCVHVWLWESGKQWPSWFCLSWLLLVKMLGEIFCKSQGRLFLFCLLLYMNLNAQTQMLNSTTQTFALVKSWSVWMPSLGERRNLWFFFSNKLKVNCDHNAKFCLRLQNRKVCTRFTGLQPGQCEWWWPVTLRGRKIYAKMVHSRNLPLENTSP